MNPLSVPCAITALTKRVNLSFSAGIAKNNGKEIHQIKSAGIMGAPMTISWKY